MLRRVFLKSSGMLAFVLSLGSSALLTGCGFWSSVATWGSIGLAGFNSIVTLLGTYNVPFPAGLVTQIRAGFQQLISDATQIENENPAPVGEADIVLNDLQIILTNFQAFLATLNIPDGPLISLVAAAASLIIGAILGYINQEPTATAKVKLSGPVMLGKRHLAITPTYYAHTGTFKRAWNKIWATGGHPEGEMGLTIGERF